MNTTQGLIASATELADKLAIQDVLFNHSRGLDRLNADILKTCYWPEAEVDYGSFKGSALQFCELVVQALPAQYELTQHALANSLIEIHSDTALVESCVTARHLLLGATEEMVFCGRYLDRLERREDQWKMLHRHVVMDWSHRQAVADERGHEAFSALSKGGHEQDPLYNFLSK